MAAPAVAIMLTAFAKLVAAEAGRRISQDIAASFIKLVFGHLATSDDVKNAVNQINAFTEQKFEDLSRENILSPVLSAQESLKNFKTITSATGFDEAAAMFFASTAHRSCNNALGHILFKYGEKKDFLRSNAALISKFIVVDIGALAALSALNSDFENVLVRRLGESAQLLKQMNRDIRVYEIPTITKGHLDFLSFSTRR